MQMCNIQRARLGCSPSFGAARLCRAAVGRDALQRPCRAAARHRCTAVGRPARTAVRTRHGSVNARHGTQCNCGRCQALRCVAATIMARVFAWIVRSLAAVQYSQCHSLRILHRCSPPLCSARGSSCRHCRRTIEVNIRNQSHSNVYLLQVSRTAQCRRHMQPAHQRYNLPRTCNSVERPKSCPDTCAKCSREQLTRNC